MSTLPRLLPLIAALALGATALASHADTTPATTPPAKKPLAHKAVKAKKPAAPAEPVLAEATPEQLEAAKLVFMGKYDCEFKETLEVDADAKHAGYVEVRWRKNSYTMKPVLSTTRAIRLEDVTGRTLVVQIANKSMLLDVKLGQRLVDDCESTEQQATTARLAAAEAAAAQAAASEAKTAAGATLTSTAPAPAASGAAQTH